MTDPSNAPSGQGPQKEDIKREIKQEIAQAIQGGSGKESQPPSPDKKEEKKDAQKAPSPAKQKAMALAKNRTVQVIAGIALVIALALVWHHADTHESTDDAYTTGHIHNISARVSDTVLEVLVDDNEKVTKDQVLVRLDPADFQVRLDQAQANYVKAKADFDRLAPLKGDEAISQQDFDAAQASLAVTQAQLDDAKNQLSYCTIRAPSGGRIGRKQVESGNRVTIGGALMAVVEDSWVVANYKETQLAKIRVGQPVRIKVDAIRQQEFTGTVDSFSPGSGSTFALLPSDNATGNFTKIVQRVPVKIVFDAESVRGFEDRLVPGLSCEPSIDVGVRKRRDRDDGTLPPAANK